MGGRDTAKKSVNNCRGSRVKSRGSRVKSRGSKKRVIHYSFYNYV